MNPVDFGPIQVDYRPVIPFEAEEEVVIEEARIIHLERTPEVGRDVAIFGRPAVNDGYRIVAEAQFRLTLFPLRIIVARLSPVCPRIGAVVQIAPFFALGDGDQLAYVHLEPLAADDGFWIIGRADLDQIPLEDVSCHPVGREIE